MTWDAKSDRCGTWDIKSQPTEITLEAHEILAAAQEEIEFVSEFPELGYQMTTLPMRWDPIRHFLKVWDEGAPHDPRVYEGNNRPIAWIRAIGAERERRSHLTRLHNCPDCKGVGTLITANGDRVMCHHERSVG